MTKFFYSIKFNIHRLTSQFLTVLVLQITIFQVIHQRNIGVHLHPRDLECRNNPMFLSEKLCLVLRVASGYLYRNKLIIKFNFFSS